MFLYLVLLNGFPTGMAIKEHHGEHNALGSATQQHNTDCFITLITQFCKVIAIIFFTTMDESEIENGSHLLITMNNIHQSRHYNTLSPVIS